MFILSSVSSGLELQLVNHTSIYEDTKSKDFKNIKVLDEISNYWPNDFFGTNVCKALKFCWKLLLTKLQCTNTTSVVSKLRNIFTIFIFSLSYS